jgi:hypothetical protein
MPVRDYPVYHVGDIRQIDADDVFNERAWQRLLSRR